MLVVDHMHQLGVMHRSASAHDAYKDLTLTSMKKVTVTTNWQLHVCHALALAASSLLVSFCGVTQRHALAHL